MKKLLLLSALLIFACTDDEGNPCIYQPTLTTEPVTNITETSATLNGTIDITSENCETPNNTEQGFVYSTEIQPTTDDIQVNVNGTNISTTIEGLEPNTTYYVRSFMTNNFGDFYGDEVSFTTIAGQIVLSTIQVNNITSNSAMSGGQILSDGNTLITSKGICWGDNSNPTITDDNFVNNDEDLSLFQCLAEGLDEGAQYYLRAYASNEFDTYYGDEYIFTTICSSDNDQDGVCDVDDNDDDNDGVDDSSDCDPFDPYAYPGAEEVFDGIDNDCDGEIDEGFFYCDGVTYDSIVYGTQEWAVENACLITYRDGTPIPQVINNDEWANLTTGAWCFYDNDPTKPILYNWYAVKGIHDNDPNTPNKEFAPEGWHVPSDAEWTTLEEHLIANGYNSDGTTTGNKIGKAMASTTGWNSSTIYLAIGNDQSLNNSSGFNAFSEGLRNLYEGYGLFSSEAEVVFFWSSTDEGNADYAWCRSLDNHSPYLGKQSMTKEDGCSVRFVKD